MEKHCVEHELELAQEKMLQIYNLVCCMKKDIEHIINTNQDYEEVSEDYVNSLSRFIEAFYEDADQALDELEKLRNLSKQTYVMTGIVIRGMNEEVFHQFDDLVEDIRKYGQSTPD